VIADALDADAKRCTLDMPLVPFSQYITDTILSIKKFQLFTRSRPLGLLDIDRLDSTHPLGSIYASQYIHSSIDPLARCKVSFLFSLYFG
jgi:hypothetical protein